MMVVLRLNIRSPCKYLLCLLGDEVLSGSMKAPFSSYQGACLICHTRFFLPGGDQGSAFVLVYFLAIATSHTIYFCCSL